MSTLFFLLIAVVLLGILIAVHEGGHFLTARLTGIPVREYAIGMGPKLLSRTGRKSGVVYSLRAIPMGGFCAFYGEDSTDKTAQEDPRAFSRQKLWKRILTVLMGPGMNFLLAFLVLFLWLWIGGTYEIVSADITVASVTAGSPAEEAGFAAGDVIVAVNGAAVGSPADVQQATNAWSEADGPLLYTARRGGEELLIPCMPRRDGDAWRIGISMNAENIVTRPVPVSFGQAVSAAFDDCVYVGGAIFRAVAGLFRGQGWDEVSGPVGTVGVITEQVRDYGLDGFLNLLVVISVNLGVMNLLPIPGLDGSRILFMLLEGVRGKAIPPEKEAVVHLAGMVLLFGLMIFLTVRDVGRFF